MKVSMDNKEMPCNWLLVGETRFCKNSTREEYCASHAFKIRKGVIIPQPCKVCGWETKSSVQLCVPCGQVSNETTSSVTKDEKSKSHKKRKTENIVQDVFDFTATSAHEKNHMTEISMTAHHEKSDTDNPPNVLQNLACLIQEDGPFIDSEEDISNDQDNILEEQAKPLVSATLAEKFSWSILVKNAMADSTSPTSTLVGLHHEKYWDRDPNSWGNLNDWDIYFIENGLPVDSRDYSKASIMKKSLEAKCFLPEVGSILWSGPLGSIIICA
ncbi:17453_t:CDS:2, partial [Funneliformis geosporum]